MKKNFLLITMLLALLYITPASADEQKLRHFMFIGQPNAAAWKFMMDNPTDRKDDVSGAFKALGGEVLSYYWGLGNGKNYITVTIPDDNELIQAIYLMRMPSGLLSSYEVVELMPSGQMSNALKRSKALIKNNRDSENTTKKNTGAHGDG